MKQTVIFLLLLSTKTYAQDYEPPCLKAPLLGRWIGPQGEMIMDEECNAQMGKTKFTYDFSHNIKRGKDECKIFQKENEIVVDCGKSEVEKYHRYNHVVNK